MSLRQILILVLIVVVGLILRVRLSQDKCLHKWDERFHALVGKNTMEHPLKPTLYKTPVLDYDYKQWYSNHIWLHKPPLPLWTIACSFRILGASEFSLRLPSILLSSLGIVIVFLLGRLFFRVETALLSAFFYSINGLIIEMASGRVTTDHYDTFFQVLISLAILFAFYNAKQKTVSSALIVGCFIGLALLTKWLPSLIVLPIHFFLLLDAKASRAQIIKYISIAFTIALCIALPWQIFINLHFYKEASWESYYNWLHFVKELEGHVDDEGFLFYFNKIRISYSEVIYLPLAFLVFRFLKKKSDFKLWALCVWIFVPIIIFSFAKMKLQGYILFISPALFMITADFFFFLKDEYLKRPLNPVMKTFSYLVLAAIIVLPIRYCYERTGFGLNPPKTNPETSFYKNLNGMMPAKTVVLNVKHPIEFMFYTDYTAYSKKELSSEERKRVDSLNYAVAYLIGDSLVSE